jgi:hypothetical protein
MFIHRTWTDRSPDPRIIKQINPEIARDKMEKYIFKQNQLLPVIIGLACFIILSGCVTAKQQMLNDGYKPLTNEEYIALFSKPVNMRWTTQSMEQGNVVLSPDKTATISYSGGIDDGTWVAENDRLCISWVRLGGGGKQCVTFFKIDENKYRVFEPSGRFFSVNLE